MRYYNKASSTEIFNNPRVPSHLRYDENNSDHVALHDSNPFFSPLPEGMQLVYDQDNVPTSLQAIPDYELNKAKSQKSSEVIEHYNKLAAGDGFYVTYSDVKKDFNMRGLPPSPTSAQSDLYGNIDVADAAIALIDSYTEINDVKAFDVTIPTGGAWL